MDNMQKVKGGAGVPWALLALLAGVAMRFGLHDGANGWDFNFHLVGDMFIAIGLLTWALLISVLALTAWMMRKIVKSL